MRRTGFLQQFYLLAPTAEGECSSGSTPSPPLGAVGVSYFSESGACVVVSYCGFILHVPNNSVGYLGMFVPIYLCEMPTLIFAYFLMGYPSFSK